MVARPAATTVYDFELAKTQRDIDALAELVVHHAGDPEKRVRLAYRQFHLATLTDDEAEFTRVHETIAGIVRDFGPMEDVCLLMANIDGRFHRLDAIKQGFQHCPALAARTAGRAILADVDFEEGHYGQARRQLETLIEADRSWDGLARLAHWHAKLGDKDFADQLYAEAEDELTAKEMRSFAWLELRRGDLDRSRGRYGEARAHYRRAEASFPGHWQIDRHMASLLAAEGALEEAAGLLQRAIRRTPKPELKQALGELLTALDRPFEARPWLDAAEAAFLASAATGAVHYYHHLADFYADAGGQPAEAVRWARKDVALRPNFSTQSALAWALYRNGDIAEGLDAIQLALASGAQDSSVFGTASALFNAAGDAAQGKAYALAAATINSTGVVLHLHV